MLVNVVRKQLALCAENVIDHREIIRANGDLREEVQSRDRNLSETSENGAHVQAQSPCIVACLSKSGQIAGHEQQNL
jgi:hypothetical protein